MNNLQFDYNSMDIHMCGKFESRCNILSDSSGTGKTLLLSTLLFYCMEQGYRVRHYDYAHPLEKVELGYDILLLDNADLYLTQELLDSLCDLDGLIVISGHKVQYELKFPRYSKDYYCDYLNRVLNVKEFC